MTSHDYIYFGPNAYADGEEDAFTLHVQRGLLCSLLNMSAKDVAGLQRQILEAQGIVKMNHEDLGMVTPAVDPEPDIPF